MHAFPSALAELYVHGSHVNHPGEPQRPAKKPCYDVFPRSISHQLTAKQGYQWASPDQRSSCLAHSFRAAFPWRSRNRSHRLNATREVLHLWGAEVCQQRRWRRPWLQHEVLDVCLYFRFLRARSERREHQVSRKATIMVQDLTLLTLSTFFSIFRLARLWTVSTLLQVAFRYLMRRPSEPYRSFYGVEIGLRGHLWNDFTYIVRRWMYMEQDLRTMTQLSEACYPKFRQVGCN